MLARDRLKPLGQASHQADQNVAPAFTMLDLLRRFAPRDDGKRRSFPHPVSTGPPAFFHASMPPAMCAVLARPASLAAATAMAERSPNAQKNTMRRPVAAATSRNMPPGERLSSIEG